MTSAERSMDVLDRTPQIESRPVDRASARRKKASPTHARDDDVQPPAERELDRRTRSVFGVRDGCPATKTEMSTDVRETTPCSAAFDQVSAAFTDVAAAPPRFDGGRRKSKFEGSVGTNTAVPARRRSRRDGESGSSSAMKGDDVVDQ